MMVEVVVLGSAWFSEHTVAGSITVTVMINVTVITVIMMGG